MIFEIESKVVVRLEHQRGAKTSELRAVDFNLDVSDNVDKSMFLDKEGLPTKDGTKALTQGFVQGLAANILVAHAKGYWDSAEHLRYIIAELEKGFVRQAEITKSTFTR